MVEGGCFVTTISTRDAASFQLTSCTTFKYNSGKYVDDLRKEILILRGDFEASEEKGDISSRNVRGRAVQLGEQLENISEENLGFGSTISKYEYTAYAYFLAASVESEVTSQQKYSRHVINYGEKAIKLIEEAEKKAASGDEKARAVIKWVNNGQDRNRIRFIMAVAHAINIRSNGGSQMKDIHNLLNGISPDYLENYPPAIHPDLASVLNEEKGA